ncbi:SipW-dependent-type signal peptide-containing protein [Zhihengliuella flava]|uniref:Ribosomally synthesized peptide with SipW-like signal peptide n=1 Tax=Zhihengliuella flava TaxID=1285193 RepID=A0A931D874_9MICC|nr:SipW-dependent-type signal peptide-containing protein [Zhihengliuella flava]MBG6085450.1 putative ribosomally synthesized peptide with SipW-like signal peptide [Zhihengliuella flava]
MGRHTGRREHNGQPRYRWTRGPFTKVRALLAGGLVLGIGVAGTLAAWTDPEYSRGEFTASVFGIVGNTGTGFAEHTTNASAAQMTFGATAMSPGSLAYGYLDVRTTTASTVGGTLTLTGSTPAGAAAITDYLTYRVAVVPTGTTCASATYSGTAVSAGSVFAPATATVPSAGSTIRRFCFQVQLATTTPNTAQGQSGTITWQVTGSSD